MKKTMALLLAAATVATGTPALAQTAADTSRVLTAQDQFNRELSIYRQEQRRPTNFRNREIRLDRSRDRLDRQLGNLRAELDRYQSIVRSEGGLARTGSYDIGRSGYDDNYRDDPNYDPARYYREGNYRERTLAENDRVYRGNDGRYYCKRPDGTTGLIVGGVGGAVLGNVIDGGRSRAVGTILGAIGGAIAGRAIDRSAQERSGAITCR